jgi:carboxymethylenebutenolidase
MTSTRIETVTAPDGGTFDAHLVVPDRGHGPGLLVLQEIFGVNEYIRDVCERLAALGYTAMAPDAFWRIERNVECGHDDAGMQRAFGYIGAYDWAQGIPDLAAALALLRSLPETGGRAGAIGFCFGGTTSFALAQHADPDVVVSYYGSGVPDRLAAADGVSCPMLLHFGGDDPYIPRDRIAEVERWAAARPTTTCFVWPSGHAFDNSFSAMFSDPVVATQAWDATRSFLTEHHPA